SLSFAQAVLLQFRHFILLLVQPRFKQQSARVTQEPLLPTHAPSAQVPLPRQEACAQQLAFERQTVGLVQDASATSSFASPPRSSEASMTADDTLAPSTWLSPDSLPLPPSTRLSPGSLPLAPSVSSSPGMLTPPSWRPSLRPSTLVSREQPASAATPNTA